MPHTTQTRAGAFWRVLSALPLLRLCLSRPERNNAMTKKLKCISLASPWYRRHWFMRDALRLLVQPNDSVRFEDRGGKVIGHFECQSIPQWWRFMRFALEMFVTGHGYFWICGTSMEFATSTDARRVRHGQAGKAG
jgi:hypothetical protein